MRGEIEIQSIVEQIHLRQTLSPNKRDHSLKGNLSGFRDCHVRGDVVLIYKIVNDNELRLVRIGSHSELGL